MTANHEHTPSTERVMGLYAAAVYEFNISGAVPDPDAEFDRWHAAEIAAAEQRGAVSALREAADEFAPEWPDKPDLSATRGVSQTRKWLRNRADRIADQMEGRP